MTRSLLDALVFVLDVFVGLYILILLLRLFVPFMQTNYQNPLLQGIMKATSPLVIPVRRLLPPIGRVDTATLVVAFGFQYALVFAKYAIYGRLPGIGLIAVTALFALMNQIVRLFMFAIIIRVILSWISPGTYNPATALISGLTDPIMRPFQRLIPPLGGFDISPIFAIVALGVVSILLGGLENSVLAMLV